MGFTKTILKEGNGSYPTAGKEVTVHCTGFGKNGDLNVPFWSTKDKGQQPFTFTIGRGQVIKGWDEGVLSMKLGQRSYGLLLLSLTLIGEIAKIECTPDYGYGADGFPAWGMLYDSQYICSYQYDYNRYYAKQCSYI